MEHLKPRELLTDVDPRQLSFQIRDTVTGDYRQRTLADHYYAIQSFVLHDGVPSILRDAFISSCNVLLYSWFSYDIIPVAELHSLTILEWALRARAKQEGLKQRMGLPQLLGMAVEKKWICDDGLPGPRFVVRDVDFLEGFKEPESISTVEEGYRYVSTLSEVLPKLRNKLAHGTRVLYPGGHMTLALVAGLINQLWLPSEDEVGRMPPQGATKKGEM